MEAISLEADISLALGPGQLDRPEGLHVSDIIANIMQGLKPKKYQPRTEPLSPSTQAEMTLGSTTEQVIEAAVAGLTPSSFRPPSLALHVPGYVVKLNGKVYPGIIWGSPDRVDVAMLLLREFKLTWYSAKKEFPSDDVYWPWLVQVMFYLMLLGYLEAIVTIVYINGDYHPPTPWPPQSTLLRFTAQELHENQSMLVNHAIKLGWLVPE